MAKNTKKITEKHTAPDNFSKRIENIPAGVVSKIAKIDELKGQPESWGTNPSYGSLDS